MPPKFALFIGAVFVLYAFRSDRKRRLVSPSGIFWPTLWYMTVSSRMLGVWLQTWGIPLPGGGDAGGGSLIDASFFLLLTIIGFRILAKRRFEWSAAFRANPWLTALFVFMAASICWSSYPFVSFKRYVKILGSVAMAFVVLSNDQPLESFLTLLRRCLYVHLPMSIICIKYFREIGVAFDWSGESHSWQGISTSKNDLGQVAMLGLLYFAWEVVRQWPRRKWKNLHVVYLLMAMYLLKGSEDAISMTSVSVGVFAVMVFLRLQMLRSRPAAARGFTRLVFAGTVSLVSLILIHSVVMFSSDSLFGHLITTFGRNITLTDRTYIWHDVYAAASRNPLMGVGFGGFWIGREANIPWAAKMTWVLGQGHNGYIDTYLQVGLIGSALLAGVIFSTIPKLLRALDEDYDFACLRITIFLTILFVNVTETTYLRGDHHLWFVMMLVVWIIPRPSATNDDTSISVEPVPAEETADPAPAPEFVNTLS
ncbi:MAG TPA: O-antigen ligase family protein [Opitutaceae bacterium]|nr:O-antigen ligase family protein [Opitutaceae bacterium]